MSPNAQSETLLVGYDPGGEKAHGLALCEVEQVDGHWCPRTLQVATVSSVREALDWVETKAQGGRILAVGLDTLTEWNSGNGGWRPADFWLRKAYPAVRLSVTPPNALFGSMAINGASFLHLLAPRFLADGTQVTEAHPKVLHYALRGQKHAWAQDQKEMTAWLLGELGLDPVQFGFGQDDHIFDATLSLLPALRGLNGDWTLDLHTLSDPKTGSPVRFAGPTHYWWPAPTPSQKA